MGTQILVKGQNGIIDEVSNGKGLGIKQHDDVMLSYGYSRKVTKKFTLPSGQFGVLVLRVPEGLVHHAEGRFIQCYNAPVNFKVVIGKTLNDLPALVETLPAFNQKYAVLDPTTKTIIEYRGTHAANPIGTVDADNTIDDLNLYAETGQGTRASSAQAFSSLTGRYYDGVDSERIIVALFENIDSADATIEFVYSWHEF